MIAWSKPRRAWWFAGVVIAAAFAAAATGLPIVMLVVIPYWLAFHHLPTRRRRAIAHRGDACARCWGLFEPGDARHPYRDSGRAVLVCDACGQRLDVMPSE